MKYNPYQLVCESIIDNDRSKIKTIVKGTVVTGSLALAIILLRKKIRSINKLEQKLKEKYVRVEESPKHIQDLFKKMDNEKTWAKINLAKVKDKAMRDKI